MDAIAAIIAIIAGLIGFDLAALHRGSDSRPLDRDCGQRWSIR